MPAIGEALDEDTAEAMEEDTATEDSEEDTTKIEEAMVEETRTITRIEEGSVEDTETTKVEVDMEEAGATVEDLEEDMGRGKEEALGGAGEDGTTEACREAGGPGGVSQSVEEAVEQAGDRNQ